MKILRPIRATKLEILQFIGGKRIIFIFDLVETFGYTYLSAFNRLRLLRAQGLAISDGRGHWVLTDEGMRRLKWLRQKKQAV